MEHIHNIEIKNFKSIRHAVIDGCKRVNVFIGAPNVGKSNILEALGLYSVTQQVKGERFFFNSICRYNHFSDFYFDKNLQNKVSILLNGKHTLSFSRKVASTIEFEIFIQTNGVLERSIFSTNISERGTFAGYSMPSEKEINEEEIYKIKYYLFQREVAVNGRNSSSLSIPSGDNLLDILNGNSNIRKLYADLLTPYNLRLNTTEDDIAVAKELNDGTFVSFRGNLVAETLRRLFFYLAAMQTNANSVLLFEEPEAHMYPPYIAKFTSDMMYDENNNQYFITTHSPFVISDIMENLKKEDYAIYTVGYDKENGETLVKRLSNEELHEIYQYGIDLFLNLENYLPHEHKQ